MAAVRRTDTKLEVRVRSMVHRRGLRYRKDYPVRVAGHLVRPDIAFTRAKVAVFIDGCFWHLCPDHGQIPASNTAFWKDKLERNAARDLEQTRALESAGWTVLRIWEHVSIEDAVQSIVNAARGNPTSGTATRCGLHQEL
jgi:DNA mismatch endonuclease, patch repair protein